MKKNSFTEAFYKNAGYIVIILVSLVYMASSLISIEKTGKSVWEILGAGVLSMIVGFLINGVFRQIGIRKGDEDERTVATNSLHASIVEEITPYIDKLDTFCELETKRTEKGIRTRLLASAGLKYEDYFTEEGISKPFKLALSEYAGRMERKSFKRKKRAYKKAIKLKIKPLLASNLTSDGTKADNPYDFGKTKREYTSMENATDIVIKVLLAIIFGYFGVSMVSEVNVAALIWNALQIVMYIIGGVIQMYSSFSWVVDDYRQSRIKKIDTLQKFKIYAEGEKENAEYNGLRGLS